MSGSDGIQNSDIQNADPQSGDTGNGSVRLAAAQQRVAEATAAHETARAAADLARGVRTARLVRVHRWVALGALLTTLALIATTVVLVSISGAGRSESDRAAQVIAAARAGITTALTADPSRPGQYVDAVLAVSTGAFRQRIAAARSEIESSVAAQPIAGTGQVVSAGIVGTDPGSADAGTDVLVVAEATNPQLLGGGAGDARVVLLVRMIGVDGSWKIEQAQLQ